MASLGKLPFVNDPQNPLARFRDVLGQFAENGALPDLPPLLSWKNTIADNAWQAYGNDEVGDCTIAAACHMMMCWSDNSQPVPWSFNNNDVIEDYNNYRTSKNGASLQNILWDWKKYGIRRRQDANPIRVKIEDFALLDINNQARLKSQVQRSVQLLGGCYIGIVLPKFAVRDDPASPVPQGIIPPAWDVTAAQLNAPNANADKDPKAGHCVCAIGYNNDGLDVVTWGLLTRMSWDFFFAYTDEAWAVLCKSGWLKVDGKSPSGLSAQQLDDDFNVLRTAGQGQAPAVTADAIANVKGESVASAQVVVPDVTGLTRSAAEALLNSAGLTVGAIKEIPNHAVPADGVSATTPAPQSLVSPGAAVALQLSTGPETSRYQWVSTALFALLGIVLLWVIVHVASKDGQGFLTLLARPEIARGLITFLIAIATVGIAIILAISTLVLTEGDGGDKRFDRGKQVLSVLIGVLGTIVGFYFGSQSKGSEPPTGYSVTAQLSPMITTKGLPEGKVGVAYDATLEATGGTSPLKWTVSSPLPNGLTLTDTGKLQGTPTATSKTPLKFTVKDSSATPLSSSVDLTLDVK
jgi:hypothetical protein